MVSNLNSKKSIYEKRSPDTKLKNENQNEIKDCIELDIGQNQRRKTSVKKNVKYFEDRLKELEKLKNNKILIGLTHKYGLNSYLDFVVNSSEINSPDAKDISLKKTEFTTFIIEIQKIIENYEKDSETLKKYNQINLFSNIEIQNLNGFSILVDKNNKFKIENQDSFILNDMINLTKNKHNLEEISINRNKNPIKITDDTDNEKKSNNQNFKIQDCQKLLKELSKSDLHYLQKSMIYYKKSKDFINITALNEIIITHFDKLLMTIFNHRKRSDKFSFSLLHEYLEDLFLFLYDTYLNSIVNKIDSKKNEDIWILNSSMITNEIIDNTISNLLKFNFFKIFSNNQNILIEDFEGLMISYFDNTFINQKFEIQNDSNNFESLKENCLLELLNEENNIKSQLKEILIRCKNNILAGKIICQSQTIFDFKTYYLEVFNLEFKNDHLHFYNENNNIDALIFKLKYNYNNIKGLTLSGNSKGEFDFSKKKLVNTILFYTNIENFSINEVKKLDLVDLQYLFNILNISNLKSLNLSNNFIEDQGVKILTDVLKFNKQLISLDLSRNQLTSNSGFYLGELLHFNNKLENLYLSGNLINHLGFQSFLTVLSSQNKNLKNLDISENYITPIDFNFITNLILKSHSLLRLNLSNNKIDSDNLNSIGLALKNNKTLRILSMSNVDLNSKNSPFFFQHLNDTFVTEFIFDSNEIGEIGGILISNILRHNKYITKISLKNCSFNSVVIRCFIQAFEKNANLKYVNIEDNHFDMETIKSLDKSLENSDLKVYMSQFLYDYKCKNIIIVTI